MAIKTRAEFKVDKDIAYADNVAGDISADDSRVTFEDSIDSSLLPEDLTTKLIIQSPDGSSWLIVVDNAGNLSATGV